MSDKIVESLAANRKRNNLERQKTLGYLSPFSYNVSMCSSQSASQEASTLNVVERVPRLLFSFRRKTKNIVSELFASCDWS